MGTGSGYRGDTYISRRVNLSTAMEFCGYDSNLCSCGDDKRSKMKSGRSPNGGKN